MMSAASTVSQVQSDRIAAYRRRRPPDSLSDARPDPAATPPAPGDKNQQTSDGAPPSAPHAERNLSRSKPPMGGAFGAVMAASGSGGGGDRRWPGAAGGSPSRHPAGTVHTPRTGSNPVEGAVFHELSRRSSSVALPHDATDIRSYIFDLELQNRELRQQIESIGHGVFPSSSSYNVALDSDDAKRDFLTNVLSQVEGIVEAHRNKSNAEIQKYKAEAEQAKLALEQLREFIRSDGLDLTLAPAMIAFHQRQEKAHLSGKSAHEPSVLGITFPKETEDLLRQIGVDILAKLQGVSTQEQLGAAMNEATRAAFQKLVVHFTDEVVKATEKQTAVNEVLRAELVSAREDLRRSNLAHETKLVDLVTAHAAEMDAMKDQLRVLVAQTGAGGPEDQVSQAMHEKAFAEYAQLLVDARREAAALRAEIDAEKTRSAEVCLKLKATLERRREEFERDLVMKAEEIVAQRDRTVAELESKLRGLEKEFKMQRKDARDAACQAGEPLTNASSQDTYIPAVVQALRKTSRIPSHSTEVFERDVWQKTQDLLSKYGALLEDAAASSVIS